MKRMYVFLALLVAVMMPAFGSGQSDKAGAEKIQLTVQDYFDFEIDTVIFNDFFKRFQAEHPNVTFVRNSLPFGELHPRILSQCVAKDEPDILMVNNFDVPYIADAGALRKLDTQVAAWGQWNDFFKGSRDACTWKGSIYTIHEGTNNLALFYNPKMFADAGLTKPPETWDELLAYCAKLTKGDTYGIAFSATNTEELPWQLKPFLWTNGGEMNTLDKPESIAALQLWVTMVEKGWASRDVVNWGQGDVDAQFQAGKAAMMIMGPWDIPGLQKNKVPFEIATIPTPRKGMIAKVAMGGETYGISPFINEKRAQIAWEYVKFQAEKTSMYAFCAARGYIPTRQSLLADYAKERPILNPFITQLPQATRSDVEKRLDYKDISTITQAAVQSALVGKQTAKDAFEEAARKIQEITAQ